MMARRQAMGSAAGAASNEKRHDESRKKIVHRL
jgi:hypothetical protein